MLTYLQMLVRKLDKNEKKCLKQYLTCFDPNFSDEHEVKTLKLFEAVECCNGKISANDLYTKIYPDGDARKLDFLALRLISKIHESLLLDVNTERQGSYTLQSRAVIEVRKKLILAQVLWSRDLTGWMGYLLTQVIRKARQFELFGELQEALLLKQQLEALQNGLKGYQSVQPEIEECNGHLGAVKKVKHFYSLLTLGAFENQQAGELPFSLGDALAEAQKLNQQFSSHTLRFYLSMLRLGQCQAAGNYTEGSRVCSDLVDLLSQASEVFNSRHLGIAYAQWADNDLFTGDFDSVLRNISFARKYFPATAPNSATLTEAEFYAYFYSGNFGEAARHLHPLLNTPPARGDAPFLQSKRWFLFAAAQYKLGSAEAAAGHLLHAQGLLKEKYNWNPGYRLMEIMLLLEKNQTDRVELLADSLRKHLKRFADGIRKAARYDLILKMVQRLIRADYQYGHTLCKSESILKQLSQKQGETAWEIKSPEVIPFHTWIQEMAQKESSPAAAEL